MFELTQALRKISQKHKEDFSDDFEALQKEERAKLVTDPRSYHGLGLTEMSDPEQQAEGYALLGEFEKAIELTKLDLKRKEYTEMLNAIGREKCNCPTTKGTDAQGRQVNVSPRFLKDTITRKGEKLNLYHCSNCDRSYA